MKNLQPIKYCPPRVNRKLLEKMVDPMHLSYYRYMNMIWSGIDTFFHNIFVLYGEKADSDKLVSEIYYSSLNNYITNKNDQPYYFFHHGLFSLIYGAFAKIYSSAITSTPNTLSEIWTPSSNYLQSPPGGKPSLIIRSPVPSREEVDELYRKLVPINIILILRRFDHEHAILDCCMDHSS